MPTDINTVTISTPSDREVVITRIFDAPRRLVFEALTKPELIRRWSSPEGWTMEVCEVDLKPGGEFHFVSKKPSGKLVGQRGVYREVVPHQRLVNTEWWEDWNPGECLVTTELTDVTGRTVLTSTTLFPSQEVRDTILKSGLNDNVSQLYGQLAAVLMTLR